MTFALAGRTRDLLRTALAAKLGMDVSRSIWPAHPTYTSPIVTGKKYDLLGKKFVSNFQSSFTSFPKLLQPAAGNGITVVSTMPSNRGSVLVIE